MKHWTLALLGVILAVPSGTIMASEPGDGGMRVLGRVFNSSTPVPEAIIIALSLSDSMSFRSGTDAEGAYQLPILPRGIYRILAVKRGFAPAMATIVPTRPNHAINFNLKTEENLTASEREEIWKIRRAIPADVLRELDMAPLIADERSPNNPAALSGMLYSLAGIADSTDGTWTQTTVGLEGSVDGWEVGVNGRMASSGEVISPMGPDAVGFESSAVAVRIQSSGDSVYELSSNRSRWTEPAALGEEVILDTHRVGWKGEQSNFEIRYLNHQNILSHDDLAQVAVAGETRILDRDHFDVGVGMKIEQFEGSGASRYEVAEVSTTAQQDIGRALRVAYGVRGRYSDIGTQWVPETSARLDLGRRSSIIVSGHYKVYQDDQEILTLPALLYFDDRSSAYPHYRYAFGVVFGSENEFLSAMASVAEIDAKTRLLFDQRFDGSTEGLWLDNGDVTKDLTLRLRRMLAGRLAVEVASTAGEARGASPEPSRYLTGSVQSLYRPWGTSLDLAYRYIEQAEPDTSMLENERLAVRMGQSLWLPLDLRVLLGIDFIRDDVAAAAIDGVGDDYRTRVVGGLSLAF